MVEGEADLFCCPKCGRSQPAGVSCVRCGVIFSKIRLELSQEPFSPRPTPLRKTVAEQATELLLDEHAENNRVAAAGRTVLYMVLLVYAVRLVRMPMTGDELGGTFMHLINLPFHEAGHLIFAPFGRLLMYLGGTLGQFFAPAAVAGAFLWRHNRFGTAVGVWWLGQSMLDIAPYIADARAGQLMLLGGVTGSEVEDYHDWEVILRELGGLQYDQLLGAMVFRIGEILMILSLAWGVYLLWRQWGK